MAADVAHMLVCPHVATCAHAAWNMRDTCEDEYN